MEPLHENKALYERMMADSKVGKLSSTCVSVSQLPVKPISGSTKGAVRRSNASRQADPVLAEVVTERPGR